MGFRELGMMAALVDQQPVVVVTAVVVVEGGTKKTAFSLVRPHIFASVECLGLYFNRTHNTQNLLLTPSCPQSGIPY